MCWQKENHSLINDTNIASKSIVFITKTIEEVFRMQHQPFRLIHDKGHPEVLSKKQPTPCKAWIDHTFANLSIQFALICLLSFLLASQSIAAEHIIHMTSEEVKEDELGNKLLAYKMLNHTVDGISITHRYSNHATIPGPTIILTEGDTVELTIYNDIPGANAGIAHGISSQVSVHVHGVHYEILSDGTLKVINQESDQGAGVGPADGYVQYYTYRWNVAPGTAGTWPYHDHNFETHNGAEHKGLYGALIVNPAGVSPDYAKEFVLFLTDDAFWGMEIDKNGMKQKKHGVNPDLIARKDSNVRFHLIALGTDIHEFTLKGYQWKDPGTDNLIDRIAIGPIEKHVFSVTATHNSQYADENFTNKLMGMMGKFKVSASGN
jgi:manganese oxidase